MYTFIISLSVQFCPLYILYNEEFPAVFLRTKEQYIKQSLCTSIVLPEDGPVRSETCRS